MITIYKHTLITTGEAYIGQTSQTMMRRWRAHISEAKRRSRPTPFQKAILTSNEDGWKHEILATCQTVEEANRVEQEMIKRFKTKENGFNLTVGGRGSSGRIISEETRKKMSLSAKNRPPVTSDTRRKLSEARKGKPKSPEHRHKISIANTGHVVHSSTREKLRVANLGREHNIATKEKIGLLSRGKSLSNKHRERIRAANKGKPRTVLQIEAKSKTWRVTTPSGSQIMVRNLAAFCRENDLSAACMRFVAHGVTKQHKGFTCEIIQNLVTSGQQQETQIQL